MAKTIPSFLRRGRGAGESRSVAGEDTWIQPPSLAGVVVTERTATRFGAIYACINVLSSDGASVPFQVVRRDPAGGRSVDHGDERHDLVCHSPDGEMSSQGWIGASIWHCNTHGNTYTKIIRDKYLKPAELMLLDPDKVRHDRSKAGKLYYEVCGEIVLPEDMIHVANVGPNGIIGKSPIRECMETIGLGIAVEKFGAAYFGNGITPKGIITTPNKLDQVERDELRKQINAQHQSVYNAHRFMLLEGAAKFEPTSIPAEEAQFIATRKFQLEEICRIFRVPPTKVMNLDRANFANLEEVNLDYYDSSLKPWIRRFEGEFLRKLFTREERRIYAIEHDVSQLLKGRIIDQANADKLHREMGVLNADEIRARKGLPPIEGGKVYLVPLNFAPLDKVASASIETLKGVKPEVTPGEPTRALTTAAGQLPDLVVDGEARTPPKGLDQKLYDAAGLVVLDVARRMAKREAGILRKIAKGEDIASICEALEARHATEPTVLAEAFGPCLALYSIALGLDEPIKPEDFARDAIESGRRQILACIEGPDTKGTLAALADRWEGSRSFDYIDLLPGFAKP